MHEKSFLPGTGVLGPKYIFHYSLLAAASCQLHQTYMFIIRWTQNYSFYSLIHI